MLFSAKHWTFYLLMLQMLHITFVENICSKFAQRQHTNTKLCLCPNNGILWLIIKSKSQSLRSCCSGLNLSEVRHLGSDFGLALCFPWAGWKEQTVSVFVHQSQRFLSLFLQLLLSLLLMFFSCRVTVLLALMHPFLQSKYQWHLPDLRMVTD